MVRRMRNEELGTRRRLRKRIKPHPKEEAMSRPQVTVRRVGRRPTAIRNSARPRRSLDSQSSLGMTRGGGPSPAGPQRTCLPYRSNSDREPRSGDRYLAWGVSPRNMFKNIEKAPEGRQIFRSIDVMPKCAGGTPAPQGSRHNCGAGVPPALIGRAK